MPGIEHVVALMSENRSFAHLLGLLPDDPAYGGGPARWSTGTG